MADALGSDHSLLGSTASGFTYGRGATPKRKKGLICALCIMTILIGGILAIIYVAADGNSSLSPTPPPTESYLLHGSHINVDKIQRISRFRGASNGESFPGVNGPFNNNHTCGTLKHWFQPFSEMNASDIIVYSPLTGKIIQVSVSQGEDDSYGYDIRIQGSPTEGESQYIVQIGHVNITDHDRITGGNTINYGYPLGHHIGSFVMSDISILNQSAYDENGQYISMFNVIDSGTLKQFQQWNVSNRTYPVITDPQRRIYPLNCSGTNQIVNDTNYEILENWVYLNTSFPPIHSTTGRKIKVNSKI